MTKVSLTIPRAKSLVAITDKILDLASTQPCIFGANFTLKFYNVHSERTQSLKRAKIFK